METKNLDQKIKEKEQEIKLQQKLIHEKNELNSKIDELQKEGSKNKEELENLKSAKQGVEEEIELRKLQTKKGQIEELEKLIDKRSEVVQDLAQKQTTASEHKDEINALKSQERLIQDEQFRRELKALSDEELKNKLLEIKARLDEKNKHQQKIDEEVEQAEVQLLNIVKNLKENISATKDIIDIATKPNEAVDKAAKAVEVVKDTAKSVMVPENSISQQSEFAGQDLAAEIARDAKEIKAEHEAQNEKAYKTYS